MLEQYPQQVKIVYKSYPLDNHPNAMNAAAAAFAAQKEAKFWEFHDLLFKNYSNLSENVIANIVLSLGLDPTQFAAYRRAPETSARINKDMLDGKKAGVNSVPAVFVNGILLKDHSLNGFRKEIGAALQRLK